METHAQRGKKMDKNYNFRVKKRILILTFLVFLLFSGIIIRFLFRPNNVDKIVSLITTGLVTIIILYYFIYLKKLTVIVNEEGLKINNIFQRTTILWDNICETIIFDDSVMHIFFNKRKVKLSLTYFDDFKLITQRRLSR